MKHSAPCVIDPAVEAILQERPCHQPCEEGCREQQGITAQSKYVPDE